MKLKEKKNFLTLTKILHKRRDDGKRVGLFKCDCGSIKEILITCVKNELTKSCGCFKKKALVTHGEKCKGKTSVEYKCWQHVKDRCNNKNNKNFNHYGGRGIRICKRWLKFENFLKDMGRKPSNVYSIDRINYNGNYEPNNCRWATTKQQRENRRTAKNEIVFNGENASQANRRLGLSKTAIHKRIRNGWDKKRAFNTPARRKNENL